MLGNWKNWCRLCAKRDAACADKQVTMESIANQLEIINNFFSMPLLPFDGRLFTICKDCITLMENMESFKNLCLRTEKMFEELIQQQYEMDVDVESVRRKYGFDSIDRFDDEDIKYCNANADYLQDPLEGAYTDPLETLETEIEIVKQEVLEVPEVPVVMAAPPAPPVKERNRRKSKLIEKIDYGETTINENFIDEISEVGVLPPLKKRGRQRKPKIMDKIDYSETTTTTTEDFDDEKPKVESMTPLTKSGPPEKSTTVTEKIDHSETTCEDFDDDRDDRPTVEVVPSKRKRGRPKKTIVEETDFSETVTEDFDDNFQDTEDTANGSVVNEDDSPRDRRKSSRIDNKTKGRNEGNICEFCFKKFPSPFLLCDHIWEKHNTKKRPFECSNCQKRYPSKRRLERHMTTHLPDELRLIHPCPHCDMKFMRKAYVKRHVKNSHKRTQTCICEKCGKICNTRSALISHMEVHIKEYNFSCSTCSKKFKSRVALKGHEEIHSNEVFTCDVCGKKLKTRKTLRTHKLVHLDTKKYKCNFCGNRFRLPKTLKNHLMMHSGLRPYVCEFCDKTFTFGSSFRLHKKKVHPGELAALEASGQAPKITRIPTLAQLQPEFPVVVPSSSAESAE